MKLKLRWNGVVLALVIFGAVTGSGGASDRVAATLKITSFNSLVADIGTVATSLQAVPPGMTIGDTLSSVIDQRLGTLGMKGIDRDSALYFFVLIPESGAPQVPSVVSVIPVTDQGTALLQGLSTRYAETNFNKGVYHFFAQGSGSGEGPDELYASVVGSSLILAPVREDVVLVAAQAAHGELGLTVPVVPGTMQFAVDLPVMIPLMEKALAGMSNALQQAHERQTMPNSSAHPDQILSLEGQWLLRMARQLKSVSFSLSADAQAIRFATDVVVQPGSKLEDITRHLKPVSPRYTALLPADSLATYASGGMNAWDEMMDPYLRFMDQMRTAMGQEATNGLAAMCETLRAAKGLYAGDMAAGIFYREDRKGLSFVEYVAVKDGVKARQYIVDSVANSASTFSNANPGVKISLGQPRMYKGTEILSVRYAIDSQALMSAIGSTPTMTPLLQRLTHFTVEFAIVSNTLVTAAFSPPAMDAALDQLSTPGTALNQGPVFTALCPEANPAPVSLYTLRLVSLLKAFLARAGQVDSALVSSLPESTSGLAGYTYLKGNEVIGVNNLGMAELATIRTAGPILMRLMMQGFVPPSAKPPPVLPPATPPGTAVAP